MLKGIAYPIFLALALLMTTPAARGCPVCDGEGGREVRAGLFGRDFASNFLACAAPFPIFLGIVAFIHGAPSRGPDQSSPTTTTSEGASRHG